MGTTFDHSTEPQQHLKNRDLSLLGPCGIWEFPTRRFELKCDFNKNLQYDNEYSAFIGIKSECKVENDNFFWWWDQRFLTNKIDDTNAYVTGLEAKETGYRTRRASSRFSGDNAVCCLENKVIIELYMCDADFYCGVKDKRSFTTISGNRNYERHGVCLKKNYNGPIVASCWYGRSAEEDSTFITRMGPPSRNSSPNCVVPGHE